MIYVIDSHPIIWHLGDRTKLSAAAETVLDDPTARIIVPTIVLAEIRHLYGRRRVATSPAQVREMLAKLVNSIVHHFDEPVLERMPAGLEIHDAIIVATTLLYRESTTEPVGLVTDDERITDSGLVDVLW